MNGSRPKLNAMPEMDCDAPVLLVDLVDLMAHRPSDLHGITACHRPLMSFAAGPRDQLARQALAWCAVCFPTCEAASAAG
jgi:hypothetical protein